MLSLGMHNERQYGTVACVHHFHRWWRRCVDVGDVVIPFVQFLMLASVNHPLPTPRHCCYHLRVSAHKRNPVDHGKGLG